MQILASSRFDSRESEIGEKLGTLHVDTKIGVEQHLIQFPPPTVTPKKENFSTPTPPKKKMTHRFRRVWGGGGEEKVQPTIRCFLRMHEGGKSTKFPTFFLSWGGGYINVSVRTCKACP